ncbi:FKBP-type peptidyl-prolyl cis-trans isomerase, partial [Vibrio sp. 2089]
QVIKGWQEGLQYMVVGEKIRLFVPSTLGYGKNGTGPIPPASVLIFDVELLEIQ